MVSGKCGRAMIEYPHKHKTLFVSSIIFMVISHVMEGEIIFYDDICRSKTCYSHVLQNNHIKY